MLVAPQLSPTSSHKWTLISNGRVHAGAKSPHLPLLPPTPCPPSVELRGMLVVLAAATPGITPPQTILLHRVHPGPVYCCFPSMPSNVPPMPLLALPDPPDPAFSHLPPCSTCSVGKSQSLDDIDGPAGFFPCDSPHPGSLLGAGAGRAGRAGVTLEIEEVLVWFGNTSFGSPKGSMLQ